MVSELFLDDLDSLPVLVIKVLEGIDDVKILKGYERLLEDSKVKHLYLLQSVNHDLVGQGFKHEKDVYVVIHGVLRDYCEFV